MTKLVRQYSHKEGTEVKPSNSRKNLIMTVRSSQWLLLFEHQLFTGIDPSV